MAFMKWATRVLQSKRQNLVMNKFKTKKKLLDGADQSLKFGFVKKELQVIVGQLTTVKLICLR
jgi:hypothetical protein